MSATAEPRASKQKTTSGLGDVFRPNKVVSPAVLTIIAVIWALGFLVMWLISPFKVLPRPGEVISSLSLLWGEQGLGQDLLKSFALNLKALGITTIICLGFAYLSVIPFFRPLIQAVSKGRFLSLVGFSLLFTLAVGGGSTLKLTLLVFGMSVFFLTSMASVVAEIPKEKFDHARTLRMSEWRVVWDVVILGTIDQAFEVIRQNAAIGWMMLTMVEGIVRSEGGVGAMLLNEQKHFNIPAIFAIQLIILLIGLFQDFVIGILRSLACPYSRLTLERK